MGLNPVDELLNNRLQLLKTALDNGDTTALDTFWAEIQEHGAPIIEPAYEGYSYVTFLWRDMESATTSVNVIQDWGADGILEHLMTHLPGTDIWYKTRFMPSDTRTTYQLAPEPPPAYTAGSVPFIPDPLNPHRFLAYADDSGFKIWFSFLELPDAPAQPWLNTDAPAGTVSLHTPFADGRRIWVYVPHTTAPPPYSLLVVFDGHLAFDFWRLPQMLDYLIAQQQISPVVALFVDTPDRRELLCVPEFADCVAQRIVPWGRSTFAVTQDTAHTVISGASYGGLCAAYTGMRHSEVFGGVLSQTGWFRWHPDREHEHEWLARQYIGSPKLPLRFYMDVGILETARMVDSGPSQLVANRYMRDVLRAKGYEVIYREYGGGHDYSSTSNPLFDALPLMLPKTI
jgi:enterochelin esterase-like enzyme